MQVAMEPSEHLDAVPDLPPPSGVPAGSAAALVPDPHWRRRHPASPLVNSLDMATRLAPFAIIALLNGGGAGLLLFLLAAGVAVSAVLRHLRYTYLLEADSLTVRSGVFVQQQRTIPADRVQQVSVHRKLRHLVLGVADVSIESAGAGTDPEVRLSSLSLEEAERVRVVMSVGRRDTASPSDDLDTRAEASVAEALAVSGHRPVAPIPPPPALPVEVYRQPNSALLRMAVANSPVLALPVVATVVAFMLELGFDGPLADVWGGPNAAAVGIGGIATIGLVGGTAATVLRFYDLRLERVQDDLGLHYGILTQRRAEIPRERVQVLVEERSIPGRAVDVVSLTAHNASGARLSTAATLPAVPTADRRIVAAELLPHHDLDVALVRHPTAALRRAIIRRLGPALLAVGAAVALWDSSWRFALLLLLPLSVLSGWRAYAVLAHGATSDVVTGRQGVWTERTSHVRRSRVQSASVTANWFQRRLGLATLEIHVAQPLGRVEIRDLAADEARRLAGEVTRSLGEASSRGEAPPTLMP